MDWSEEFQNWGTPWPLQHFCRGWWWRQQSGITRDSWVHQKPWKAFYICGKSRQERWGVWFLVMSCSLSPVCDCLYALEDPQYVALTPFLHVVLIRVGTFSSFPFNWPVLPSHRCWCGTALLQACSSRGSLSCCQGIKWNPALTDSFALSNSTKKQ